MTASKRQQASMKTKRERVSRNNSSNSEKKTIQENGFHRCGVTREAEEANSPATGRMGVSTQESSRRDAYCGC